MANSIEKINALVDKYSLSETVKQEIRKISSDAYIQGSNDTSKALKEHHEGVNRIIKSELNKLVEKWLS